MTMAQIALAGVLAAAPEKRFTPNNTGVTVFQLTVVQPNRRDGAPEESFAVKVTCWRQLADQAESLQAGQAVLVQGKLMAQSYQTPEGANKKYFEVEASSLHLLASLPTALPAASSEMPGGATRPAQGQQSGTSTASAPVGAAAVASSGTLSDLTSDDFLASEDDIPF